jgi:hypothetical protein
MTVHAEEEMDDDGFTIFDVEHSLLTGKITERQKDAQTGEWKYVVEGDALDGDSMVVVVKLGVQRKLIVITVFPAK